MIVRFWGTRGSLPAPLDAHAVAAKIAAALSAARGFHFARSGEIERFVAKELPFEIAGTYGGNTSCVELDAGDDAGHDEFVLCDLGSGARLFGNRVLTGGTRPRVFHVFMSHIHWDHINGFPFFTPAYIPGNTIRIYGCHENLRAAFERQQAPPSFPVVFAALGATIEFVQLAPGERYEVNGYGVTALRQRHGGDSYGYRFERDGKSVVYATDSEHKIGGLDDAAPYVAFFRAADVLIFDGMYSLADVVSLKEDWGHSSNVVGVELAQLARVKHLVLFHHEPAYDDATIARVLTETKHYEEIMRRDHQVQVSAAYDGLEIEL